MKLSGKVAVITGSSRGLGFAIARAYAKEGASVVIAARSANGVALAVDHLKSEGYSVSGLAVDVCSEADTNRLHQLALDQFGHLDIWVNNAGLAGPYGPTLDLSTEDFVKVQNTNILGTYFGSRAAMKTFIKQKSGKLINMLGHGWKGPVPYQNAYSSTKAWVRSFTKALASETMQTGVSVIAFNPGMVNTELLTHGQVIRGHEHRLARFPMVVTLLARDAEYPAGIAVKLASSDTDGKTGLVVSASSTGQALAAFLSYGIKKLINQPVPLAEISMESIDPAD